MILLIDAEKDISKIQYSIMIKVLKKMGLKKTYFNITMFIYDKSTANIIISSEKYELSLLK